MNYNQPSVKEKEDVLEAKGRAIAKMVVRYKEHGPFRELPVFQNGHVAEWTVFGRQVDLGLSSVT